MGKSFVKKKFLIKIKKKLLIKKIFFAIF